ncbi:gamma-tubulin complex component 4 [Marchantia polymorpha subsp. ruderalis]|uniref:Gamma-tubulin complex component n=2 Tax=Marchantia polymorpha TaxID=3197 RepID=A0AAF6BZZ7_MARPO|nr:hypothetical protein MARPO_0009s0235 [Marchantia polymorpha]BBN17581.1 hypothetical protein Mp_7g15510 [Marchantia polymorpha subsp. ruderalis]|eukprot:PTQ47187.1 hypothetical protein MARPO_0009s0235 [Marchantia polymorpha]
MLHELLLALVGCTGDVFMDVREQAQALGLNGDQDDKADVEDVGDECTFRLAPDISFLQQSERELLDRLLRLGFYYRELDRFVMRSRNLSWIRTPYPNVDTVTNAASALVKREKAPSVYRRALANGIAEVLAVYRSAVLKVEQNLLSDPVPVLASVTQGLHQFEMLLPPLYALVREVEREELKGGRLLNLLHAKCHCGIPELQACMQRLLWHGHQVMYRQLAAWMVYGLLQDQHMEFFISRRQDSEGQNGLTDAESLAEKSGSRSAEDARLADWHTGFHVCLDMLPEYMQLSVAESILFVGKAVRVLRNPSTSFKLQPAGSQRPSSKESQRPDGVLMQFVKDSHSTRAAYQRVELLPQEDADKIASVLRDLKESREFHKMAVERAVDTIRAIAATHLWQLVVVHADLLGHLRALKDYFLLAKGDFFQCFLEESRGLMRLPPRSSSAEADLKVPFQQAAIKTIGDDDKYFSRVSLRMPNLSKTTLMGSSQGDHLRQRTDSALTSVMNAYGDSSAGPAYDGWDGLALEYSIDWPLQLLFTREVLAKYSKIFQYLLRLKRIQLELEKSWAEAMHYDRADSAKQRKDPENGDFASQRRQLRMPMWRVRQHMTYLITNLQFYIQVDVIESQWNLLQERVEASKDFTELARFHQEYLSALISQSFLDIGSVSRILDSIIKLCLQLCRVIEQQEGTPSASELEQITEEFNKKSNSLYTILRSSKLAGSQRAPFLRQFLLRLNYNSFFEATARGALNMARPTLAHR